MRAAGWFADWSCRRCGAQKFRPAWLALRRFGLRSWRAAARGNFRRLGFLPDRWGRRLRYFLVGRGWGRPADYRWRYLVRFGRRSWRAAARGNFRRLGFLPDRWGRRLRYFLVGRGWGRPADYRWRYLVRFARWIGR